MGTGGDATAGIGGTVAGTGGDGTTIGTGGGGTTGTGGDGTTGAGTGGTGGDGTGGTGGGTGGDGTGGIGGGNDGGGTTGTGGGTDGGGTTGTGGGTDGGGTTGTGGGTDGGGTTGTGGTGGSGTGTGGGGTTGTAGASGTDGMCASAVAACPAPAAGQCTETFCGGRVWGTTHQFSQNVPYRILDPSGKFTLAYRNAIKAGADAWAKATSGVVAFEECTNRCAGRFVSIVPGDGDGIVPAFFEQVVPLPTDPASLANIPLHRIAHQWGHVLGLGHTYERADRDLYVRFDPSIWCGNQGPGVPPVCAYGPEEVGSPSLPSDTFGVYDEQSKMNGFRTDGVCGNSEPDPKSGEPTAGDAAAVEELFFSLTSYWSPFQPVGRPGSAPRSRDYQLAPGVDPIGAPTVATWTAPAVEIFVRGTGNVVYTIHNQLSNTVFQKWSDWQPVGLGIDADPAAAFADADTLHLVVRLEDKTIRLRTRVQGVWGPWAALGAPPNGAASAPALAVRNDGTFDVVALGGDGFMYTFRCDDPSAMCAASAARSDAWKGLPGAPYNTHFVGKPSADWSWDGGSLMVTAVTDDANAWLIGGLPFDLSSWWHIQQVTLDPNDPQPHVAVRFITHSRTYYARNERHSLLDAGDSVELFYGSVPLGGVLASAPGVVIAQNGVPRIDVVALIEDHGRPGVWWKFYGGDGYTAPCNYNAPGTCAQCGCNGSGQPSCAQ